MLTFTYRGNMIIAVHYSTLVSQNRATLYCPNVEVSRRLYKYFFHKSQIVAELYTMLYVIFYVHIFLFMHICSLMIFNSENKPVKILLFVLSKMLNIILKGFCNLSIDNQTISDVHVRVMIRYHCGRGLCSLFQVQITYCFTWE